MTHPPQPLHCLSGLSPSCAAWEPGLSGLSEPPVAWEAHSWLTASSQPLTAPPRHRNSFQRAFLFGGPRVSCIPEISTQRQAEKLRRFSPVPRSLCSISSERAGEGAGFRCLLIIRHLG